jgi:hypothetical protein
VAAVSSAIVGIKTFRYCSKEVFKNFESFSSTANDFEMHEATALALDISVFLAGGIFCSIFVVLAAAVTITAAHAIISLGENFAELHEPISG